MDVEHKRPHQQRHNDKRKKKSKQGTQPVASSLVLPAAAAPPPAAPPSPGPAATTTSRAASTPNTTSPTLVGASAAPVPSPTTTLTSTTTSTTAASCASVPTILVLYAEVYEMTVAIDIDPANSKKLSKLNKKEVWRAISKQVRLILGTTKKIPPWEHISISYLIPDDGLLRKVLPEEEGELSWRQLIDSGGRLDVCVKDTLSVPNALCAQKTRRRNVSEHLKCTTIEAQLMKLKEKNKEADALKERNDELTAENKQRVEDNKSLSELLKSCKEELKRCQKGRKSTDAKIKKMEKKIAELMVNPRGLNARIKVLENDKNVMKERITIAEMVTRMCVHIGSLLNEANGTNRQWEDWYREPAFKGKLFELYALSFEECESIMQINTERNQMVHSLEDVDAVLRRTRLLKRPQKHKVLSLTDQIIKLPPTFQGH
ncbi:hypothetical protein Pelo_15209 [Pelomyxa schiedti]|nr:hypothetical protein Pelo_15209 [Pelomyxa schiedti]